MITVFTPTYNRAYTLGRLYNSLKSQTKKDFEWIIIDDDSNDNTESLVETWQNENNDFKIVYKKVPHGGKHRAWNIAVDLEPVDTKS